MQEKIITIYCLCADFLIAYGYKDDKQVRVTNAEIMTIALVAAWLFYGNQESSRRFLIEHGYLPQLSKSRFNRRLHAIPEAVWQALFSLWPNSTSNVGFQTVFLWAVLSDQKTRGAPCPGRRIGSAGCR